MWIELLQTRGYEVRLTDAGTTLRLRGDSAIVSWTVRHLRRTPHPSEVRRGGAEQVLWLPAVTPASRARLHQLGVSWVSDSGEVHLYTPWGLVSEGVSAPPAKVGIHGQGEERLSPGALVTLQFLLEHPAPVSQHQIASAVGLSQPRVSQVLKELREGELALRATVGWQAHQPERGLAVWLAANATPATLTLTWFSLASAREQVTAIWHQADVEHAEVRLCGDWAADLLAPWRQPGLITIHADRTLDLDNANFVPAPAETATMALHVGPIRPDWRPDPDVLAAMSVEGLRLSVAPVTEIAREIAATGGSDADQAIDVLTTAWVRARAAVVASREP